ncbi:MAG: putative DNA-binding domain-containing protein [Hyphomicrobiales bacterium]|nr:putative DNA-binding domain-containing protein [Hyphomicrobiales bacterium]
MMAVDQNLTLASLTDFLSQDYPRLRRYVGETAFNAMARHCLAATDAPGLRVLSMHLPDFLALTKPFSRRPEIADLARLERAFQAALNAPEATVIRSAALLPRHIEFHPSVQRLQVSTNATSIWSALTAGELPPSPASLELPQELLVWRQGLASRFRMLGREEAVAIDAAARGETMKLDQFSEGFLRGWLEAEIVSAVRDLNDAGEK